MGMKTTCGCDITGDNPTTQETVKKIPCCKEEVKVISNASDFESLNTIKIFQSSCVINCSSEFNNLNFFRTSDTPLKFIFYNIPKDLPVKYSSLLI